MKKKFLLGVTLVALIGAVCVGFVGCDKNSTGGNSTEVEGGPTEDVTEPEVQKPESKKSKLEIAYDAVYAVYGDSMFYEMGEDKSYIMIDTNPVNSRDFYLPEATDIVKKMNEELGLPEYIYQTMITTTALQGRQNVTANGITVSWTYHPDNGLEIMYIEAQ